MDRKLLDILCCPVTKQPLALLDKAELAALSQVQTRLAAFTDPTP